MKHIKNSSMNPQANKTRFAKTSENFFGSNFLTQQIFSPYSSFSQTQISTETNPSHYKGKVARMEDTSKLIAEELALHESERKALKLQKQQLESILQAKLDEENNGLWNELDRLKNEVFRHIAQENAETVRLRNHEASLKSENEVLKQKISGLQTRIMELEKNVGNKDHDFKDKLDKYPCS